MTGVGVLMMIVGAACWMLALMGTGVTERWGNLDGIDERTLSPLARMQLRRQQRLVRQAPIMKRAGTALLVAGGLVASVAQLLGLG
jgi:hypothetical protein